jgi:hypothetical protein
MKDIFLSRPTWIEQSYQKGLDGFISLLKAHSLQPRTIGANDYPIKSPLDEVINLMRKCFGVIILGIPQIVVEKGQIKNTIVSKPIALGTEWNHIEAALAHCLGIPMLVIHDKTITRGIFDRGALNSFLYSFDLSDPSWPLEPSATGAVQSWVECLLNLPLGNIEVHKAEKLKLQWGCYKFEGQDGLYCPACYKSSGKQIPCSRIRGGIYKCPLCKAEMS